jgi:hypothetical protein
MAKKNHKRTCYALQIDWELYGERDSQVDLFSSLQKAQKKMSECIKDDVKNYINRFDTFDTFEYDDLNDNGKTVINKLPIEIFTGKDSINAKWATFYCQHSEDFITYSIVKRVIG